MLHCQQSSLADLLGNRCGLQLVQKVTSVGFQSILFVSFSQGSLVVAIIMIDSSQKHNHKTGFELQTSHVTERRSNISRG